LADHNVLQSSIFRKYLYKVCGPTNYEINNFNLSLQLLFFSNSLKITASNVTYTSLDKRYMIEITSFVVLCTL